MRKSKAKPELQEQDEESINEPAEDHPMILAIKAASAYIEATILLMETVIKSENPEAVCDQIEKTGLLKKHLETGEIISTAIKDYADKMKNAMPENHVDTTENE